MNKHNKILSERFVLFKRKIYEKKHNKILSEKSTLFKKKNIWERGANLFTVISSEVYKKIHHSIFKKYITQFFF